MTTTEMHEAAELMRFANEKIAALEQELDSATARAEVYEDVLARIRRLVAEFTDGDQNPHRGMLLQIDRVAAEALS